MMMTDVTIEGVDFDVDNELETKRYGIQLGVDYGFGGGRVGLTAGYGWAKADGDAGADLKANGWNIGVYGQFGGLTGFHGEFLAKHDRYNGEFDDGAFDGDEVRYPCERHRRVARLSLRHGRRPRRWTSTPASATSRPRSTTSTRSASTMTSTMTSTRGRAGLRAIFGGGLAPYVDATVYHEFNGDGDVELFDGGDIFDLDTKGKATWVRLEAGLSGNDGPGPILAAWGDIGDRKAFGLRAGWRFGRRGGGASAASAAAPAASAAASGDADLPGRLGDPGDGYCPPPPPPPPPPPAPERG